MTGTASRRFVRGAVPAVAFAVAVGGCAREQKSAADSSAADSSGAVAPSPMDSTMPGMAHEPDGGAPAAAARSAGEAMDHQQMGPAHASGVAAPATAPSAPGHAMPGMAGMDHARMAPAAAPSAGVAAPAGAELHAQHAGMPQEVPRGPQPVTPPAEHAMAHEAAASPLSGAGAEELLGLVRTLVQDSVVQQAIRADPALREAWDDAAVRAVILSPR